MIYVLIGYEADWKLAVKPLFDFVSLVDLGGVGSVVGAHLSRPHALLVLVVGLVARFDAMLIHQRRLWWVDGALQG